MSTAVAVVLVAGALVVGALVGLAASGGLNTKGNQSAPTTATSAPPSSTAPTTSTTVATTTTTSKAQAAAQLLSAVHIVPSDGATHLSPSTVVTITAPAGARLVAVRVRPAGPGAPVTGTLDAQAGTWRATGQLLPATAYLVSYEVAGAGGLVAYGSSHFTTAPPAVVESVASLFPSPGIAVGIGQPIVIYFSHPVDTYAAQQAVLSHLHLAMSKPVPGGWHWFSSVELHFRPQHFWPVGEEVELTGNLSGWDIGGGEWGEGTLATSFAIGPSHITVVNVAAHEMTVYDNGKPIYTWPISAGAPNWPTQDGTHIVLDRSTVVRMVSSSVGIPVHSPGGYDELVYWDVHISSSGEYIHAAPWDLPEQGLVNISHGCVNLSPVRAETFFRFSRAGDVVQVVHSSRPPVMGDQGVMDWSFGPSVVIWTPAKVSKLTTSVTVAPTSSVPPPKGAPYTPNTLPPA
jgi:lipoprotein-anchoring transpeptidase ErfK/SrfK